MTIGELIAHFKKQEQNNVENIAPLTEDTQLRNGLVAWKAIGVTYKEAGAVCEATDEVEQWNWLWEQVTYDQSKFGIVAGLRTQDIGSVIARLKGLRLIYPDGSINGMARQFLQSQIMAKLAGKRSPGRPKKDAKN